MKFTECVQLIYDGESETVEFKKSTGSLKRASEVLCSFLNTSGGTVFIGVTPEGDPVGQDISDKTQREIAGILKKFEPPAPVELNIIDLQDSPRKIIALSAPPPGDTVPFTFDGRAYHRVGSTTSVMPMEQYESLLLDRMHSRHRWENRPASGITINELSQDEIIRTVRVGMETGRMSETDTSDLNDVLRRLGLYRDPELLNAAVVLFGTDFLPDYPQCQLRMARFKGTDKTSFVDSQQLHGNGFKVLEEAMLFLRRHLPVAGRILPGLFEREDEPLFPLAALREAVVNAVCHRDYSKPGGAVSLAIFDDRLEIWNDGILPSGLTIEDLKQNHTSQPRNPLIAGVFYRRGYIELWGRGTQKIVELCVQAGHPEPEFIEQAGSFGVRFVPSEYITPHRVSHDLTDRQRDILHILSQAHELPFREIRAKLSDPPSDRTIRMDLDLLRQLGLITSQGHGRGAVWTFRKDESN
ncbi:ATP-binding protein [Gemmatimonadota bacterium]